MSSVRLRVTPTSNFVQGDGVKPFDLDVAQMFGHSPKTVMVDETVEHHYEDVTYSADHIDEYLNRVLQARRRGLQGLADQQG